MSKEGDEKERLLDNLPYDAVDPRMRGDSVYSAHYDEHPGNGNHPAEGGERTSVNSGMTYSGKQAPSWLQRPILFLHGKLFHPSWIICFSAWIFLGVSLFLIIDYTLSAWFESYMTRLIHIDRDDWLTFVRSPLRLGLISDPSIFGILSFTIPSVFYIILKVRDDPNSIKDEIYRLLWSIILIVIISVVWVLWEMNGKYHLYDLASEGYFSTKFEYLSTIYPDATPEEKKSFHEIAKARTEAIAKRLQKDLGLSPKTSDMLVPLPTLVAAKNAISAYLGYGINKACLTPSYIINSQNFYDDTCRQEYCWIFNLVSPTRGYHPIIVQVFMDHTDPDNNTSKVVYKIKNTSRLPAKLCKNPPSDRDLLLNLPPHMLFMRYKDDRSNMRGAIIDTNARFIGIIALAYPSDAIADMLAKANEEKRTCFYDFENPVSNSMMEYADLVACLHGLGEGFISWSYPYLDFSDRRWLPPH